MNYADLRAIRGARRRRLQQYEELREVRPGIIVTEGGQTTYAALGEHFTWTSFGDQTAPPVPAWNNTALREAGTAVFLARSPKRPYRWEIIGINNSYETETSTAEMSRFVASIHGANHSVADEASPGPDPTWVYQPMMMMFKTVGDGATLTVLVYPYFYIVGGQRRYFAGASLDLTSYVPGAGLVRAVLIYLNRTSGLPIIEAGTAVIDNGIIPVPEPTIPAGTDGTESAWVILANGQTAITTATDILDARDFLKHDVSTVVDGLLVRAELTNYSITVNEQNGVSGNVEIDHATGNSQKIIVDGDITSLSFLNAPAAGEEGSITLYVVQGGSGSYYITWPGKILWPSGTLPTISTAVGSLDVYVFKTIDGGITYIGAQIGRNHSGTRGSITVDAVIENPISASISADAVIEAEQAGSITADAVIEAEQAGSITADADIEAEQAGSITADADIEAEQAGSITADADIV